MLEEKLDLLTKEIVALRQAVEANTAAGGATSSGGTAAEKPAAAKGSRGRPKKEEVEPEHSADEVEKLIRKVSKDVGTPAAKKIIKDAGASDLADLLTMPAKFDKAYAAAEAALAPEDDGEGDEEEDI